MKQPKKLTYEHKRYLSRCNLDPRNWRLQSDDKEKSVYVNIVDGSTRERIKSA